MLVSLNWLSRHVALDGVDVDRLANEFTLRIAEVEGVSRASVGPAIVVAEVLEATPMGGTSLRRCVVDSGAGRSVVVCGAKNVAAGQRVALAPLGAAIGGRAIERRSLHGVESEGMLLSEQELGVGPDQDGILVLENELQAGRALASLPGFDDVLIEIDNKSLTHRPDLWGHRGIAREVAAMLGRPLRPLDTAVAFTEARPYEVRVESFEACRRYCCAVFSNVRVGRAPLWLRLLLHRVGVRPLNDVVDLTNFVMLDLGQPLHAFDRKKLAGDAIFVRRAKAGESARLLDGALRALSERDLVIADANGPIALAGVMGGESTAIDASTTDVVLESASFDPSVVRLTSQRLALRTEASARFEKNLDMYVAETAARSFSRLLLELVPSARVESALVDVKAPEPAPRRIALRLDRLRRRLGAPIPGAEVQATLRALEFGVEAQSDDLLEVQVPVFRATKDITEEIDLVEEVGRCFGYGNITPAPPIVALAKPNPQHRLGFDRSLRSYLTLSAGLDEILTYSFAYEPLLEKIGAVPERRLLLKNPISEEMKALRTELASNLLLALQKNALSYARVGVFELGRVFLPAPELAQQPKRLGLLLADRELADDPGARLFFELKGVAGGLGRALGRPLAFRAEDPASAARPGWIHPVRHAAVTIGGRAIGYIGELHPTTRGELELSGAIALGEIDLDAWFATERAEPMPEPPPRHPAVFRDFAFVVPEAVRAEQMAEAIRAVSRLVESVEFRSVFRGAGIPSGTKSLAWSVTLREPARTLAENEVNEIAAAIVDSVGTRLGGTLR